MLCHLHLHEKTRIYIDFNTPPFIYPLHTTLHHPPTPSTILHSHTWPEGIGTLGGGGGVGAEYNCPPPLENVKKFVHHDCWGVLFWRFSPYEKGFSPCGDPFSK